MKFRIKLITIAIIFWGNAISYCQKNAAFDSIKNKVYAIIKMYPDSASQEALHLLGIAKKNKNNEEIATAYSIYGFVKMNQSNPEEAIKLVDTALTFKSMINNPALKCKCYSTYGHSYQNLTDNTAAIKNYVEAIKYCKMAKDNIEINNNFRALAKLSSNQDDSTKTLEYLSSLVKVDNADYIRDQILTELTYGDYYNMVNKIDESNKHYDMAYNLAKNNHVPYSQAWTQSLWAINYAGTDLNKTLSMMLDAQAIFDTLAPNSIFSATNIGNIGEVFRMFASDNSLLSTLKIKGIQPDKNLLFSLSEKYLKRQLEISNKNKSKYDAMNSYGNLSHLYADKGQYKEAHENFLLYHFLHDSIYSQKNKNAIARLIAKQDVDKLEAKNERQKLLNYFLILLGLTIIVVSYYLYKNLKIKQKIQQYKISELENEKQLATVDALLKGQQEERSRIAKDLHDGLGGMLNGVKLSFNNMKENLILPHDHIVDFERCVNQLDTSITELRKISHNLMPDVLANFGLDAAVKEYCNSMNMTGNLNISYVLMGNIRNLGSTADLYIYRIFQELITNAIKHGKAHHIIAQLTYDKNKILITVDDDGCGFEEDLLDQNGIGLKNTRQRVKYLKGNMDVQSMKDNGTSINIELNI